MTPLPNALGDAQHQREAFDNSKILVKNMFKVLVVSYTDTRAPTLFGNNSHVWWRVFTFTTFVHRRG